jgi:hypothetical protein
MTSRIATLLSCAILAACAFATGGAEPAPAKPAPDAQFNNWLFKTPGPAWKRLESGGTLTFAVDLPPGDFCTLTLFPGGQAEADFGMQFARAVDADLKAKGTVKIEADTGPRASKSQEGFDVLTRNLQCETAALHTYHMYIGGQSRGRFDLAAFQTSSMEMWNKYGGEAATFLMSLKLANSVDPAEVARLVKAPATPPALPGFDSPPTAAPAAPRVPLGATAAPAAPAAAPGQGQGAAFRPLETSPLVANTPKGPAVQQKNGTPIDGLKLSQHDRAVSSPNILVTPDNTIHVAFIEEHRTTYAHSVYYTASTDGGKTFSTPKNLSEVMPEFKVGLCYLAADGQGRVYVIWRTGLKEGFGVSEDPHNNTSANLVYRVLDHGQWSSKPTPVHPPGSTETQDNGSLASFVATDPAGRVHVVFNANPDRFHPELMAGDTYKQHVPGIGAGLVFDSVLEGAAEPVPREIHMAKVTTRSAWDKSANGYDTLDGYVDADGAHYLAQILTPSDSSTSGNHFHLFEGPGGQKETKVLGLPGEKFLTWHSPPKLLRDARGRQHVIYRFGYGEQPAFRDQIVGSDGEATVIRQAAQVKGTADNFQAFQGPGGRMIVCMQMNDTGEKGEAETYVSVSDGGGWSTPVNVTNNALRMSFASKDTSRISSISTLHRTYPGPVAGTVDRDGHLLLIHVANESTLFGGQTAGISTFGGESTTPILRFLKF